jgi:hypothetical protein
MDCQGGPEMRINVWRERARDWLAVRAGRWQYRLGHHRHDAWGGPFNGQQLRRRLFEEMTKQIALAGIVETGTHRGTTTAFFRRISTCPIYSFETNPRHYAFAAAKLKDLPNLHLRCCDSRVGLRDLADSQHLPGGRVFFYFDAHWAGELPLAHEIDLAFRHWPEAVVMVDDFEVPDDPGYSFDDFGSGKALTLSYLADHHIAPAGIWFPRCASDDESGERRGCVVLAQDSDVVRRIDAVTALRRWT